jgi:hypothetical protein
MRSLAASLLVILALALIAAGLTYWQPDGIVGVGFGVVVLAGAVLVERRERAGGA